MNVWKELISLLRPVAVVLLATMFTLSGCGPSESPGSTADGHSDHGDGDTHEEDNDSHGEEEVVEMSDAMLREYGVVLEPLAGGPLSTYLALPAEIGVNQDTLAHITPRVPGIASEVLAVLGERVEAGQTLAVLESSELGEAKITLLQSLQQHEIAFADVERQRTISANTERLLALLAKNPVLASLQADTAALRIGVDKGRLISAYARLRAADANYARERSLRTQGLSTEADLLAAQENYNSGLAEYMAVFEEVDFMYSVRLQEAERAAGVAASGVQNAERRLHLLGLSDEDISAVADEPGHVFSRYVVTAPIGGRVIAKHITPGEKRESDEPIYTIADLSTVWLNIAVYERYANQIAEGLTVVVHAGDRVSTGQVVYMASSMTEGTRTVTARVVLDNANRDWRAGEFLSVQIETGAVEIARRVPLEAIQQWEGEPVVFVRDGDALAPRPVQLGLRNDRFVEITSSDIALGTSIVVENSFLMKAELGKSAAGHDH